MAVSHNRLLLARADQKRTEQAAVISEATGFQTRDLGRVGYAEAMRLQDELVDQRVLDEVGDTLLLLEHPPVVTLGRRGSLADVYMPEAELTRRGIGLERTTRGGLVTYHGPGQLVGYPIVKLRARGLSVPCYVRALELTLVRALAEVGIAASIDEGHVGVWTTQGKIAAIGVAQRHGVTLHGFAVNLQPDLAHFALINPCGIGQLGVTSAQAILSHPIDVERFKQRLSVVLPEQLALVSCRPA